MRMVSSVNWPHVVNLGNSIIGVSILTMPFCFQQCGIILGTILLLFCTWMTLVSCQLLMKAGITSRRKSYEFLAYHTLGGGGKFVIEFLLIGLQLGTMIAQIVVIGDLGPSIVSKFTGFENTNKLRSGLIVMMCLFVGLPLGLLKNVRSLSSASTMCVCFYTVFVISMIITSIPNLWMGNWVVKVRYWRTEGLFQCIPIFSLAFGCQTQLFILYDDLPEPSFKVINKIVSNAVNICSVAYLLVGFFGYIAFCSLEITGDIINMLAPSLFTDLIKLAFVLSIAVTFPLIIFPCRTSLYTMLFPRRPKTSDGFEMSHQIPELHFKLMTIAIVVISMVIGMSVPNVEFILGLNGATMGTLICYIMPALFFLKVMSVTSEGKSLAKLVLVMGILVLLISTYTTLNFQDKSHHAEHQEEKRMKDNNAAKEAVQDIIAAKPPVVDNVAPVDNGGAHVGDHHVIADHVPESQVKEKDAHRHEPPVPKPPDEVPEVDRSNEKLKAAEAKKKQEIEEKKKANDAADAAAAAMVKAQDEQVQAAKVVAAKVAEKKVIKDAAAKVKKEEKAEKKQEQLLIKLEEQHQEQKKILEEQRELLKELKKHREEEHVDTKLLPKADGAAQVAGVQGNILAKQPPAIIPQMGINTNQGLQGGNLQAAQAPNIIVPQQKAIPLQNMIPQQQVPIQQNVPVQQNVPAQQYVAPQQIIVQQPNVVPQQPNVVPQKVVVQPQNVLHQNLPIQNQQANIIQQRDSANPNLQQVPIQVQVAGQAAQVPQQPQQILVQQPPQQAAQMVAQQPIQVVAQQPAQIVQQQQAGQVNVPLANQQAAQVVAQPIPQQPAQVVAQQPAQVVVQQQPAQVVVQQQPAQQQAAQVLAQQQAAQVLAQQQAAQVLAQQQAAQVLAQQQAAQVLAQQQAAQIAAQQQAAQVVAQPVQQQAAQVVAQPAQQQAAQVVAQPAQQAAQQAQQLPAQVNIPNQQGRRLMHEITVKSKPSKDSSIHKTPLKHEPSVRHKRDVLLQMKERNHFTVKSEDLPALDVAGLDKKHFDPVILRSLKSMKKDSAAAA